MADTDYTTPTTVDELGNVVPNAQFGGDPSLNSYLSGLQQKLKADPAVQAIQQNPALTNEQKDQQTTQYLLQSNQKIPPGYVIKDGTIHNTKEGIPWDYVGMAAGTLLGPELGALGGGGTAAATGLDAGTAGGATAAGAGIGAGGAAGTLASTAPLAGTVTGLVPTTAMGAGAGTAGGVSSLGTAATAAGTGSTIDTIAKTIGAAGKGVGQATTAAGNNDYLAALLDLQANQSNQNQQSTLENELLNRSTLEGSQRKSALKDEARANFAENFTPGPFNTRGITPYSPQYMSTLEGLSNQGASRLATAPQYGTNTMAPLPAYTPYTPKKPGSSTLQQVGNWLSPTLSTIGTIADLYK